VGLTGIFGEETRSRLAPDLHFPHDVVFNISQGDRRFQLIA